MYSIIKKTIDFAIALIGFIVLSPVFIVLSFILIVMNKANPLFIQKRPGKDEKIFKILKFKSMNEKKDSSGNLLPDIQRLTRVGKFIRKTSLDEIPQLINVIKGDMSLIGPRPLLVEYLKLYNKEQKKRHLVRPGITGWAQVNGRNAISWEEKLKLDVWYVENKNFKLDLQILVKTIKKVLKSEDINTNKKDTMEKFNGTL